MGAENSKRYITDGNNCIIISYRDDDSIYVDILTDKNYIQFNLTKIDIKIITDMIHNRDSE